MRIKIFDQGREGEGTLLVLERKINYFLEQNSTTIKVVDIKQIVKGDWLIITILYKGDILTNE